MFSVLCMDGQLDFPLFTELDKTRNRTSLGIFFPAAFHSKNVLIYCGTAKAAQAMFTVWQTGKYDDDLERITLVEIFVNCKRSFGYHQFTDLLKITEKELIANLNSFNLEMVMNRRIVHSLVREEAVKTTMERSIDEVIKAAGQSLLHKINDPNYVTRYDPEAEAYIREVIAANVSPN
ncbi:hypothetical protein HDE_04730 [Halotydeus destructor]|nr:hypothetical protein HDE_04730 [Halotydeus destructor]